MAESKKEPLDKFDPISEELPSEDGAFSGDLLEDAFSQQNFALLFSPSDDNDEKSAHFKLVDDLKEMLAESESAMADYYPKWFAAERALYDIKGQHFDDNGCFCFEDKDGVEKHKFPITWSTLQTIVAYMMQVFVARENVFDVTSANETRLGAAKRVQAKLQSEFVESKGVEQFWRWFTAAFVFGVSAMEVSWEQREAQRTVLRPAEETMGGAQAAVAGEATYLRESENAIVFQGNTLTSLDPFATFYDPSVPLADAADKGDYLFTREWPSKIKIKRAVATKAITKPWADTWNATASRDFIEAEHIRDRVYFTDSKSRKKMQLDRGSAYIIPSDYWSDSELVSMNVTDGDVPQLWFFIMANKTQIVYAYPFDNDHQSHPFVVYEPLGDGVTTDPIGLSDLIGSLEHTADFLVNSRIAGTKTALNQKILYNPSLVDIDKLARTDGGLFIPMKRSSLATDPRQGLLDFTPKNPATSNFADLELIIRIADMITGMNDNVRGMPNSGGRKSATEVRTTVQQSGGRQSVNAMRASSQALSRMGKMMVMNDVQFLSEDFEQELFGVEGNPNDKISLQDFASPFTFPIHDGIMPLDKQGILQQFAQVFQTIAGDQELRGEFDIQAMFKQVALLSGVQNVESFRRKQPPQGAGLEQSLGGGSPVGGPPIEGGQHTGNPVQPA